jgi:hypothetical protein
LIDLVVISSSVRSQAMTSLSVIASKVLTKRNKISLVGEIVMPQNLISVCALSPTSGIYWVELGFINNLQGAPIET